MSYQRSQDTNRMDGEEKWRILIVNLGNMDAIVDERYTEGELLRHLLPSDEIWRNVMDVETDMGVDFDFSVTNISDYANFTKSYLEKFLNHNFRLQDYQQDPKNNRSDVSSGHPDFKVTLKPDIDGETDYKEDVVYVEYKQDSDSLRESQFDWTLEKVNEGYTVWVMWVREV